MYKVDMTECREMFAHVQKVADQVGENGNIVGTARKAVHDLNFLALDVGMFVGMAAALEDLDKHIARHVRALHDRDPKREIYSHIGDYAEAGLNTVRIVAKQACGFDTSSDLKRYFREQISKMSSSLPIAVIEEGEAVFQHRKRGTLYTLVRELALEAGGTTHRMVEYEAHDDGKHFFRISEEFFDGRFEAISPWAQDMMDSYHATGH